MEKGSPATRIADYKNRFCYFNFPVGSKKNLIGQSENNIDQAHEQHDEQIKKGD